MFTLTPLVHWVMVSSVRGVFRVNEQGLAGRYHWRGGGWVDYAERGLGKGGGGVGFRA